MDEKLLGIYLNDHLAGAVGGRLISRRSAESNADRPLGDFLRVLSGDIEEDRRSLLRLMERLGIAPSTVKMTAAWAAERVGRVVKLNGRLTSYSPLSRLEELEILSLGVRGKLAMWEALDRLREAGCHPKLEGYDFGTLITRAETQLEELERYRREAAVEAFSC